MCSLESLFFFFRWRQLRFVQACTPFLQIYYIITIFTIYNNTCLVLVFWTWSLCGSEAARRPLLLLLTCGLVVHIMRGSWHQWGRIKTVFFPWCEGEPCASGCDAKAHEKKKSISDRLEGEGLLIRHLHCTFPFSWDQNHGCLQGQSALILTWMNIMSPVTAAFFLSNQPHFSLFYIVNTLYK